MREREQLQESYEKEAQAPVPAGRGTTPAERYHARRAALGRVEEIVSRGWEGRASAPGSPNNFGNFVGGAGEAKARAHAEDVEGMGIEQRLEALR